MRIYAAGGHAVIAGSYALHAFMCSSGQSEFTEEHEFVPNDIDIYVNVLISNDGKCEKQNEEWF
jgi:hypothetical protein